MAGLNPKKVSADFEKAYSEDEDRIRAQLHGKVAMKSPLVFCIPGL